MDQNKEHKSRKKTQSTAQQQSSDSESASESCCLISRCVRWCCHHCFVQKPDTPEAKPGSRNAPAHGLKKQGSASQKQETEMSVRQQPQRTRTKTSQDVSGEQPTQVADPVSSAAPTPSRPSAGPADTEPSAEGELGNIKPEFVERVSKEILKQLLEALVVDGVFSNMEKEDILESNRTRANLARGVIDSVRKKGEKASKMMINHLRTKDPTLSIQLRLLSSPSASEGTSTQVIQKHEKEVVVDKPDQKNTPVFQQYSPANNITNEGSSSAPVESDDSFQKEFLDAHNAYRAKHYAPPLTFNSEMNASAQEWAEEMLKTNTIGSSDTNDGENTFYSFNSKSLKLTGKEAVDSWYKKDYDFNKPGYQKEAGTFTQLVWRDIRELGVGMATDGKRAFVVGRYRPCGNIDSVERFQKNVLPKGSSSKQLMADERFQKVFLDTHNAYRAMHNALPLTLNHELNAAAQRWADHLLETNFLTASGTDDGENTYSMTGYKSFRPTGNEAVDRWYSNIKNYDFSKPMWHKGAESFIQMVWRDTREVGVGMASDGVRTFVVGYYRPGVHYTNEECFRKNVFPKGQNL